MQHPVQRSLATAITLALACQAGTAATPSGDVLARQSVEASHAAADAGSAMYRALAAGELEVARASAVQAIRLAPGRTPLRIALAYVLLRQGRPADAEQAAQEGLAQAPADAALLALRSFARQQLGMPAQAAADMALAQRQDGVMPAARRQLQLLAADLALAQGRADAVLALLQPTVAPDAQAESRREWAAHAMAPGSQPIALPMPGLDCTEAGAEGTCVVTAGFLPVLPGHAEATSAYRAMERRDYAAALELARQATQASPAQRHWQLLRVNAAVAAGALEEAEGVASAALATRAGADADARLLAQRSWIRRQRGDVTGANADAEAALRSGRLPAMAQAVLLLAQDRRAEARERLAVAADTEMSANERLDLAYLASRAGDDDAAVRAFARVDAQQGLPLPALFDAGYAAMRASRDAEAVAYFDRAVTVAAGLPPAEAQRIHQTKRMSGEIARTWGVLASITHRNGAGVDPRFGAASAGGDQRTTQAGLEAYWRPFGYRNGRYAEVFARGFTTLGSEQPGAFTGHDSFQGGVGARWKPFTSHNLVLSLSRVFGPNVADAWLAQVGYSLDLGAEVRMDVPSWWTAHLTLEAGRYFGSRQDHNYGLASATVGRSFVVDEARHTVLLPHLFLGVEHTSDDPSARTSSGVGAGLSVRQWFREDATRGPRSYWELTAQYRARLSGDRRLAGPFLSLSLSF